MRRPVQGGKASKATALNTEFALFPAPIKGWVETQQLSANDPSSARLMDNMFPTLSGVRVRGGLKRRSTLSAHVRAMFVYETGAVNEFFAFADGKVTKFDPSSVDAAQTDVVTGLTTVVPYTARMDTVGGSYLYLVNGFQNARLYNGSTWTTITGVSTPAITGVSTDNLNYVWKHKTRLWFVEKATMNAWYLPVDSVGGAANKLSLAGVFQKGGTLFFGANWSSDSGDGMDDRMVFVSATWSLVGLFNIADPIGKKAHARVGGDLMIATVDGIIPMSTVVNRDPGSIDGTYITRPIEPSWRTATADKSELGVMELTRWDNESMLVVTQPNLEKMMYVANAATGAWARYTGWDVTATVVFREQLYVGSSTGKIYAAETTGADDGAYFTARLSYAPVTLKRPASLKMVTMIRSTFMTGTVFAPQMSVSVDYALTFPPEPTILDTGDLSTSIWDVGLWDDAIWDDDSERAMLSGWVSVSGHGYAIAPQLQITLSGTDRPRIELTHMELQLEVGGTIG
jgi:hypothetical protein